MQPLIEVCDEQPENKIVSPVPNISNGKAIYQILTVPQIAQTRCINI